MNVRSIVIGAILGIMGLASLPGPSGFCYSEATFLSHDELARRALMQITSYKYGPLHRLISYNGELISAVELPYGDIDHVTTGSTTCCDIEKIVWGLNTKGEGRFGVAGWLFANHSYYMSGRIKGSFRLPDGTVIESVSLIGDSNRVLDSCGQLKD